MNNASFDQVTVADLPNPLPADLVVLDVREPFEWEAGHIAGAVHIPLGVLPVRAGEIDPQQRTLVVCHLGGRSAQATTWLAAQGYNVVNLDGGMDAWESAGRPVV